LGARENNRAFPSIQGDAVASRASAANRSICAPDMRRCGGVTGAGAAQPTGNRILDALQPQDFERLRRHLEPQALVLREEIERAGEELRHVLFPTSGMVSVVHLTDDGASVEVGLIGNEGVTGLFGLLGADRSMHELIVQGTGAGLRVELGVMREELEVNPDFRRLIFRFARLVIANTSQLAVCNGRHSVDERCARWLLMASDCVNASHFPITHEFLSMMLGVRRQGVSVAAARLQKAGAIQYRHGHITVLDRGRLERGACECYRAIAATFARFRGAKDVQAGRTGGQRLSAR